MKKNHIKYAGLAAAALTLAGALFWNSKPANADEYKKLAGSLTNSLKAQGRNRLAISDFMARGADQAEADYAQRRLSEALFEETGIGLMDAAMLRKINIRGALWPNVLIKGEVYPSEKGVILVVKALNSSNGRLIQTMQIETLSAKAAGQALEEYRDVPSGERSMACVRLLKEVREGNNAAVDLKARYWAAKVRDPEFSYLKVDRLPGSEFSDYQAGQKFYELINSYYEQDGPITLSKEELEQVAQLQRKEAAALQTCRTKPRPK